MAHATDELVIAIADIIPPEIQHDPVTYEFTSVKSIKIQATVTDNVGVKDVVLHYRELGTTSSYLQVHMTREPASSVYTATLPASQSQAPGVEYYIEASDLGGTKKASGARNLPLQIRIAVTPGQQPDDQTTIESRPRGINKWVWVAAGVLAAGYALSKDDDDNGEETATISLTADVPETN